MYVCMNPSKMSHIEISGHDHYLIKCSAAIFISKTLLDVICTSEDDESQYSWKLIRNFDSFSLVVESRAKNTNSTPLKDGASGQPFF